MALSQEPGHESLYRARQQVIDRVLRDNDSLFTPGTEIWATENLADLRERFIEQPDASGDTFFEKLQRQLAGAPPATLQLVAEVAYVNALSPSDIGVAAKLNVVETILGWLPSSVAVPDDLREALDGGFASGGVAFRTLRPFQLWFLIRFAEAFKAAAPDQRSLLLEDPWAFKDFTESIPKERAQAQREALLHIVHPTTFETTVSTNYKRQIVEGFSTLVVDSEPDLDRALLTIREALTNEHGKDFSFYGEPVERLWKEPAATEDSAWRELITYMVRAFDASDFDETERNYKLIIAENLRRAIEAAARGDDGWDDLFRTGLGSPNNLTDWRSNTALEGWATGEETSADARRVFGEFLDSENSPERRLELFSDAFGASTGANPGSVISLGALLNFAVDPESLAFVRVTTFERVERQVEVPTARTEPAAERYKHHLDFAEEVASRLRDADVAVRDMIDVQSLIWLAREPNDCHLGPVPSIPRGMAYRCDRTVHRSPDPRAASVPN